MGIRDRLKKRLGRGSAAEPAKPTKPRAPQRAPAPEPSGRRSQLLRAQMSEEAPAPAPEPVPEAPAVTPEEVPEPVDVSVVDLPEPFTVRVQSPEGETQVFTLREGEFVCDAADRSGMELASSCRSGGCLVCCAKLLEGDVEMGEQYVLEEEDIEAGFRLLCCTQLRSDAVFLSEQESEVGG